MSASGFKLPETFLRLVLVNSLNDYGAVCAASLALSPFLSPAQEVVVTQQVTFDGDGDGTAAAGALFDSLRVSSGCGDADIQQRQGAYAAAATLKTIQEEFARLNHPGDGKVDVPYQYYYGHVGPNNDEIPARLKRIRLHVDGPLCVHPQRDLLVLVLRAAVAHNATTTPEAVHEVVKFGNLLGSTFPGPLLLISDSGPDSVQLVGCLMDSVQRSGKTARTPSLVVVRTEDLSPPALQFSLTKCSVLGSSGILGTVESVSAGVALGVLSQLPVLRRDSVAFVPVDIAINTGLATFVGIQNGLIKPSFPIGASTAGYVDERIVTIDISNNGALVWGMVSEYVLDYYGRFAQEISTLFPAKDLLSGSPAMHFWFSPQDALNWGPEATECPLFVGQSKVQRRRERLLGTFPDKKRISSFLLHLDEVIQKVKMGSKYHTGTKRDGDKSPLGLSSLKSKLFSREREGKNGNGVSATVTPNASCTGSSAIVGVVAYQDFITLLQGLRSTAPQSQYVSLDEVEWGMYIRCIARSVLQHLALRWLHAGQLDRLTPPLLQLPKPVHSFVNDFNYVPESRVPPFPSRWRQLLGSVDHSLRAGMCATGHRGPMFRGITPQVLSLILESPSVQREISNTAVAEAVSEEEIKKRAERLILRIGDTQNHVHCRSIGILVHKFLSTVYCAVSYNDGAYERLFRWSRMPRVELVYIPLHRSYSDFLLMSDMLAVMGLSPPHVVTGEDFLGLGKLAELMRGSGSFFMRRSFRGDALYTALFKNYIYQLMTRRLPIEFFIEAMRSRTGKTKVPKLGMLKFIMEVFFSVNQKIQLDDVLFVPISISYDEVLEAKIFAQELLGIPKPNESLSNMIKAFKNLKHRHGNIYIHFGDAISLKEYADSWNQSRALPKSEKELSSSALQGVAAGSGTPIYSTPSTEHVVSKRDHTPPAALLGTLGWYITHKLQKNIVITAAAVVASAVECAMSICEAEGIGLSLTRLHTTVAILVQAIKQRGGNLSPALYALTGGEANHGPSDRTSSVHSLASASDTVRVTQEGMKNLGRFLCVQSGNDGVGEVLYHPSTIVSRLGVHISANQLVHVFIDEAVLAVLAHGYGTLTSSSPPGDTVRAVKRTVLMDIAQLLRHLLAKEFPDFSRDCPGSFDSWLQHTLARFRLGNTKRHGSDDGRLTRGSEARDKGDLVFVPITPLNDFLLQLIFPYIDILNLVCVATRVLVETFPDQPLFSKPMVTAIFKTALSLFEEQNVMRYVTTCNCETVRNCLNPLLELPFMKKQPKLTPLSGKQEAHASEPLSLVDNNVSSSLCELVGRLRPLQCQQVLDPSEEMQVVKKTLLRYYADVCKDAKL